MAFLISSITRMKKVPVVIRDIDKIARDKQDGVLYVVFEGEKFRGDCEKFEERISLIKLLEEHEIVYEECANFASEYGWSSYKGQLYIDLPFDKKNKKYMVLENYLENEDGTPKMEGVMFYYLPLEIAMKNVHQDEPGFWEKWAEEF